jgi:hypothetical protein
MKWLSCCKPLIFNKKVSVIVSGCSLVDNSILKF